MSHMASFGPRPFVWVVVLTVLTAFGLWEAHAAPAEPRGHPIRTVLGGEYWGTLMTPEYEEYLGKVRPDVIHGAVLGPELASTIESGCERTCVTPMWPKGLTTMKEYHAWWSDVLPRVHRHGIKVQATTSMVNAWGDHGRNDGWFKYYNDLWEEDLLGPRPECPAVDLFERDARGELLRSGGEEWGQYRGCVNNPDWRRVLKAMVKAGVDAGFDGFMVQFPHARGPCACKHCQEKFRAFLRGRYSSEVLRRKFGINDLDQHIFECTGPRPGMPGPIDLEAREFAAICVKDCFDDVFIDYGRALKPGLIVSTWTHFRQFLTEGQPNPSKGPTDLNTNTRFDALIDERALLPIEMWGRGEDYVWYSDPVYRSHLESGIVGDATLTAKFLRAIAAETPYQVQKYDYFRWRLTVMEAVALNGVAFGAWQGGWSGGKDREDVHLLTYFDFIRAADEYLRERESVAEAALIFPRTALYWGDCRLLEPLRRLGRGLIQGNILFDVLLDERMTREDLARYDVVLLPTADYLSSEQDRMLDEYVAAGGTVIVLPTSAPPQEGEPPAADKRGRRIFWGDLSDKKAIARAVTEAAETLSKFGAPWTVQVHADRQVEHDRILLHFVNYNRAEEGGMFQSGVEAPIAAEPVDVDLRLRPLARVAGVRFLTPEVEGEQEVAFTQADGRVRFTTPGFLVYGLAVVQCQ